MAALDRFVVEAIDELSASIVREWAFDERAAEIFDFLGIDRKEFGLRGKLSLTPSQVTRLATRFALDIPSNAQAVLLRPRHPLDDMPYKLHTNRELLLMLNDSKPFSAFCRDANDASESIPEEQFAPYVESGRILKQEHILRTGDHSVRHVLYALPDQTWRFAAYLELMQKLNLGEWNEQSERKQGELLGYADWQNDAYLEFCRRRRNEVAKPGHKWRLSCHERSKPTHQGFSAESCSACVQRLHLAAEIDRRNR
jgi:hypothetical protein